MISRNIVIFRFYYFILRFKPLTALMIIYFLQITHSYGQAMGVFSVFNISYMLLKLPAGYLSDKIGRKPVIVAGSFLVFASFLILAFSGQYQAAYLLFWFAFLWGVAEALISGTVDALMYETMDEMHKADKFNLLYSNSMVYDQVGCAMGAMVAMAATFYFPLQFVAWLSVVPAAALFGFSVCFIEPAVRLRKKSPAQGGIFLALKQFLLNRRLLFYTTADVFFSTLGDVSHRFEGAYFKTFAADWVISLARVLKHVCGIAGFSIVSRIKNFAPGKLYFGSILCNLLVRISALAANNIFTPFIHMFLNFFYATAATAKTDILQHEFLPQYRASAQSIILFIKSISMALTMYLIGVAADVFGIFSAMVLLVVLRMAGLALAGVWYKSKI